jgi:hypothetical protein
MITLDDVAIAGETELASLFAGHAQSLPDGAGHSRRASVRCIFVFRVGSP